MKNQNYDQYIVNIFAVYLINTRRGLPINAAGVCDGQRASRAGVFVSAKAAEVN